MFAGSISAALIISSADPAHARTIRTTQATVVKSPRPTRAYTSLGPNQIITDTTNHLLPGRPVSPRTVFLSDDTFNVEGDCTAPNYFSKIFDSPNGVNTAQCDGSPETNSPRTSDNSNYLDFPSELNTQAARIESSTGNADNTQRVLSLNTLLPQYAALSLECPPPSAADNTFRSITVFPGNTAQLDQCPADPPPHPNVRPNIRSSPQVGKSGHYNFVLEPSGTASDVKYTTIRMSPYLNYRQTGSSRKWQAIAANSKLRTLDLGATAPNNVKQANLSLKVSKRAKIGHKVCAVFAMTATNENSAFASSTTTLDKECAVVKKYPSLFGDPSISKAFVGCAETITSQAGSIVTRASVYKRSVAVGLLQFPNPKCKGIKTVTLRWMREGDDHRFHLASRELTIKRKAKRPIDETQHLKISSGACTHMLDGSPRHWAVSDKESYTEDGKTVSASGLQTDKMFRLNLGGGRPC